MTCTFFEEMRRHIGFGEEDVVLLADVGRILGPHLETVRDRFYERLFQEPGALAVFTGGPPQIERQRRKLLEWLHDLFIGPYDLAYAERRMSIGRTHVRVGMPQHYMFAAMEIIWQELLAAAGRAGLTPADPRLAALHKLMSLETAVMLESYRESYSSQVRQEERSVAEERITRSEHLAEVGQLAASLAHEIKNPLAGISGAIQVIRDAMRPDDPHRPIIREILGQINRLDAAVKDLLIYAKPKPPAMAPCDLSPIVTRVVNLLRGMAIFRRVPVRFEPVAGLARVTADENQVEQVVINLLVNAAHACEAAGGAVSVSLSNRPNAVRLEVVDTGEGMDEKTAARAFEPFFTTKARGTGLGLSIVKKIVDAHGAAVTLTSARGAGTRVVVDFPRMRPDRD
ncbi:MAG: ATP-binding protein [Phycisphaerae bacterium]|jgi:signal transduction histidine kinase